MQFEKHFVKQRLKQGLKSKWTHTLQEAAERVFSLFDELQCIYGNRKLPSKEKADKAIPADGSRTEL